MIFQWLFEKKLFWLTDLTTHTWKQQLYLSIYWFIMCNPWKVWIWLHTTKQTFSKPTTHTHSSPWSITMTQGWLKVHYNVWNHTFKYEKIELLVCIYEIPRELVFIYGISGHSGWSSPFGSLHVLQQGTIKQMFW